MGQGMGKVGSALHRSEHVIHFLISERVRVGIETEALP